MLSIGYTDNSTLSNMTPILSENMKNKSWVTVVYNDYNIPYIILSKDEIGDIKFDKEDGRILVNGTPAKPYKYNYGYLLSEIYKLDIPELADRLNAKVGGVNPIVYVYWK